MQAQSMNNEEKLINNILFIYILGVAISGFSFVMLFLLVWLICHYNKDI